MKILRIAFLLSLLLLLQGCSFFIDNNVATTEIPATTASASETVQSSATSGGEEPLVSDLFSIKDNLTLTYKGEGSEFAFLTVYTDYTDGDRMQRRVDNGGTVVLEVLEVKDGRLTKLLSVPEGYYRENLIPMAPDEGEILLQEPVRTGNSWSLSDGRIRTITDTAAQVTTPSGSYKAVEVTTKDGESSTKDYYAPGTGLVKTVFVSNDSEISSSLETIEEDGSFTQKIAFFYPTSDDNIYYVTKEISFKTNDVTRLKMTEFYRTLPDSSFVPVFSTDTSINSLYLNKDGMVYIDLNSSFIGDMNAGAGTEQSILQCVADTAGTYYGAGKVILTVDNKPYSSGHIEMKTGEYLTVSDKKTQWER